jgi:uncharacterized protein YjiS (DUF1127 family)
MGHTRAEELHASEFMTAAGITQDDIARETSALRSVVNAVKSWNQRRNSFRELTRMNDYLLTDIGLTRFDIKAAAGGGSISLGGLFATLAELARNAAEIITGWNQRRHDYRRLSQMDDHLLADIGLRRHEIEAAIHGKISKPARQSAIRVDTLLSTALPGVATNQDTHRRAA